MSFSPIVGVYRSILIYSMISFISLQKSSGNYHKKTLFYFCICINSRYEGFFWIQLYHFLIFTDSVSDISSFYFSFSFYITRMYYIDDVYSTISELLYDFFCMIFSIWCTSLGGEKYSDVFLIWIVGIFYCTYIFFDNIVRFCIYRNYDNMLEFFGSPGYDFIF